MGAASWRVTLHGLLVTGALLLSLAVRADLVREAPLERQTLEIAEKLRCAVCQNQSVAESQVQPQPPPHHCCQHQPAGMHPRWTRQWAQASKAQAQAQAAQAAQAQAHGWLARAGSAPRSTRPRRARLRQSWAPVSSWAMAGRSQTQASTSRNETSVPTERLIN